MIKPSAYLILGAIIALVTVAIVASVSTSSSKSETEAVEISKDVSS